MPGLDANTKLLLHLNGADGATSTTDASPSGHTITFIGTAQLDTAQKQWGNASLLVNGDSDNLTIPNSADWAICGSSTDDWTIDFRVKHTDHVSAEFYIEQYEGDDNRWGLWHFDGSGLNFFLSSGGSQVIETNTGGEITDTNWHHIALCKVGSLYGIYLDGTQVCYVDDASTDTLAGTLYIGRRGHASANYFDGHIDEMRIQHSNYFEAAPANAFGNGETPDTITVPTRQYGLLAQPIFME